MGKPVRLYFIDALRAFAILMMLQGHFINGLLDYLFLKTPIIPFTLFGFTVGVLLRQCFLPLQAGCLPFYYCVPRYKAGKTLVSKKD